MNGQFLNIYAVYFFGLMYLNTFDQFVEHTRCQFLSTGIFTDSGDEHIRGYSLMASLKIAFGLNGLYLVGILALVVVPHLI